MNQQFGVPPSSQGIGNMYMAHGAPYGSQPPPQNVYNGYYGQPPLEKQGPVPPAPSFGNPPVSHSPAPHPPPPASINQNGPPFSQHGGGGPPLISSSQHQKYAPPGPPPPAGTQPGNFPRVDQLSHQMGGMSISSTPPPPMLGQPGQPRPTYTMPPGPPPSASATYQSRPPPPPGNQHSSFTMPPPSPGPVQGYPPASSSSVGPTGPMPGPPGPPGSYPAPPGGPYPPASGFGAQNPPSSQPVQDSYQQPPSSGPQGPLGPPGPPGQYNSASYSGQYPQGSMQSRYPPGPVSQQPSQPSYGQPQYPPASGASGAMPPTSSAMGPQSRMPLAPQPPPQQARRLDPDQMPSPIQVIEDDRKNRCGPFYTNTKGQVPPLVTTNFVVNDEGICNPRFMRSSIYCVPCSPDILKQTAVPFAITISPFASLNEGEKEPPISDMGDNGPVRCNRCKAYMCPYMQFIDGGRRFQCVFCKGTTEVPPEYFAHLDHTGDRVDKYQRPELCVGSYEFIATKEYCKNGEFPKPPAFIFMIDVSYNSLRNGMMKLLTANMKQILASLPREGNSPASQMRVGFVTYSNVVHFYNVKGTLAQPQMLVVSDVQDMFMPLLDGFLVTLDEAEAVIESLLEQIPIMFGNSVETETILGPVIQAGVEALKAAECAGKIFVFHTSLPTAEAPGKLKNRDDRKLLGTDKEKTILSPQNNFYNNLGQECVAVGCCVDLFLFTNSYVDVATIGQVCRLTGGEVYKYSYFQADIDGPRFLEDLRQNVQRPIAFDAIMRVRTSTGIRPTEFYGHYYMSNTTDVELAAVDCNKAVTVEIKYDDKLTEEDGAYVQAAILYTSCSGQRRLRVHNLALNTCQQMADLYRNCELDVMINYFLKQGLRLILEQTPHQVKDVFINRCVQILACYRKNCASPSSLGQLILPECMKLLPLYANCLIRCDALAGSSDMTTDDRSYTMLAASSMDVKSSQGFIYPRLLPLHDLNPDTDELPLALRCSIEKIKETGVYLLENGIHMLLWVGLAVNPEFLQDVFGVNTVARIDIDKTFLMELNTPLSRRVRSIIEEIRQERHRCMRLTIIRQGDKLEAVFRHFLVEDRRSDGCASYVDFLCHLHKEIRNQLT